jgi:ATP-dependent RNA helicase SUPV3L1/SUV3
MVTHRASLSAVLGPTNTGKTHLAVERMCAHSSGMMGFPLRLLAREIYNRIVAIKGEGVVALITGEERIEPPNARYYCCTVESMPIHKDFAFVAVDEAQLGADPERGHIYTDRFLHARGREETMILGSESLRPMVRALLPDAEIITRPRFSTLSYAGAKKLSRLPKRSAIVAFSIEQIYVVAEQLRRLRGGAAVVMGALSPRTRNAQVAMYQSGEVDYLVATDAIGMGLNLDVDHIAFAGLSKFDGSRVRRLTLAEMAQIAGRAGRHQRDGTFGTLSGTGNEFLPEEVLQIENHSFPAIDRLYWREAEPRFDNVETLIADLSRRPDEFPLVAAPEAIDLKVMKRLTEMPEVMALLRSPAGVARLWEAASLPDFKQMGEEHHARFVAQLWQYLGQGEGIIPQSYFAQELARLDNVQGDIDTLSARIAAIRTWTYVAHRNDWLQNPPPMAQRARTLEEKLSDALHDALRQRFVDRRTAKLLRKTNPDDARFEVELSDDDQVLVDGEVIGTLDGFAFRVDPLARVAERKMLLAAAEKYLGTIVGKRVEKVIMAEDSEFELGADGEGKPAILWQGHMLGQLIPGKSLLQPLFKPTRAVAGLEGDALRAITERAEAWLAAQLEKAMGGIVAMQSASQDAAIDGQVRALAIQLAEAGGIAGRAYLADAIAALPKEARGAARKAGIVFGALDIFHHAAFKPAAVKWRSALFAVREGRALPELPPVSAVHLKEWKFASAADCRNAGYRRIGDEFVRIDLAERVIKKAHEARGQSLVFGMDMAFATSLGLSEKGLGALLRDAGFRSADAPSEAAIVTEEPAETALETQAESISVEETIEAEAASSETIIEAAPAAEPIIPHPTLSYWRWVGMPKQRKPEPSAPRQHKGKRDDRAGQSKPKHKPNVREPTAPKHAPAPSALALQLAALKGLKV